MSRQYGAPTIMDVFVTRPVLAVVLSLGIILVGVRAALNLPVLQYPRVESTSLVITTSYIGASAETVQGFITEPIERVAATVPGVDFVDSNTLAGLSTVTVWMKLNEDSADALAELSTRLDQIRFELPAGAEDPFVRVTRADRPHAIFYLPVNLGNFSRGEVTDYLTRNVNPILSSIPGVQRIGLEGGRNPAMRVWIDPLQMAAFNVSAEDVQNALRGNNVIATIGSSENALQRVNLLANTTLQTLDDFKQLVVRESDDALIRLGDIARIELGEEEGEVNARSIQEASVYISVWPLPGANEIEIGDELYKQLDAINPTLPDGLEISIGYDGTLYMRDAIQEIFTTLVETILLVGLVVLTLMGSFRTAVVPLVTIPISLLGAAAAMTLMGFSLNLLTILAIVLSVGLVVDDAIVVVENVSRYMREGMSRTQAALASSRQLLAPIIGMTITLAAVYAPIGFLSGLTGLLFKEFAFTLSVAVLISGLVALTLSPIMSAYASPEGGKEGTTTRWVNKNFDRLHFAYGRLLDKVFAWRNQVLFAGLFISLLAVPFFLLSQQELAPIEDEGSINVIVQAAPDSSLEYTTDYMHDIVDSMLQLPGAHHMWQIVRSSGAVGGVSFEDFDQRERSVQELLPEAFQILSGMTGLKALPVLGAPLPTAGNFDVEMVVQSPDSAIDMNQYAQKLMAAGYQSGRFMFLDTDLKADLPQIQFILDRERIADLGMDLSGVSRQLSVLLSGNYVNRFDFKGKAYRVIPMVEGYSRLTPEALLELQLRTPNGDLVPVSAIARLEQIVAPRVLGKFQQKNAFRIYGGLIPGTTKEQGLSTLEQAATELLPDGYTIDYAGESRQLRKEGNTLVGVLGIALVFVYLVLAVQFNSFRDPLVVLVGSVPLAMAGALMFPFLGWTTINIYSQIGFITLVGLIAKNGILIVEFANHLQATGLSKLEAIKNAAETRLRPVLMTTAATALGHFPLVLVTGAGAEARNSIGIILVAGMVIGTVFTLIVLPCVYMVLAQTHTEDEVDPEHCADEVLDVNYVSCQSQRETT
ncbi:efflux RND transporter permease subunit [Pseudomaricurvus alkylphenolicus]|uniref:efflux RND transporter permease subunit n=1 Tax=Pseudomaricurvus alkylphenolicus TaxID=1306991 RepID=UPI0014229322|nr:efflux RND transporter permease subunit [Pseudomaricurvus alkylphenolicus]NIB43566.1 efflux RND transporter permease subunit [Pseudomaricurvus alkylphenolicus]